MYLHSIVFLGYLLVIVPGDGLCVLRYWGRKLSTVCSCLLHSQVMHMCENGLHTCHNLARSCARTHISVMKPVTKAISGYHAPLMLLSAPYHFDCSIKQSLQTSLCMHQCHAWLMSMHSCNYFGSLIPFLSGTGLDMLRYWGRKRSTVCRCPLCSQVMHLSHVHDLLDIAAVFGLFYLYGSLL